MTFDQIIDRRGTHCAKWDKMEALYGVSPDTGLAMWVADSDFQAPQCVLDTLRAATEHGIFGYTNCDDAYFGAITWWMENRHGWTVDPGAIFTTTGLVNGIGVLLDTFTDPGDGVVLFTPVYHAFHKIIRLSGRQIVELPMGQENGRYTLDFDRYDATMTGREKVLILCSPHNPGGMVWSAEELRAIAEFAARHDLFIISDEIHHDLVYPGAKHIPMPLAAPESRDRLIMLTAPSKTFNLAGLHTGNVIIEDEKLRARFAERMLALYIAPNSLGQLATAAAYSPGGAEWVDALISYLDTNRKLLDAAIAEIPGLRSMPLEATYLSWVDFSGTGMAPDEVYRRIEKDAKIAANHGDTFGAGGETFVRFNFATQRSRVEEACTRLREAFSDLQ